MDGIARTPSVARSTVAGTVAAVAVGAFFGARGLAVARQTGFADLTQGFPFGPSQFTVTLVALTGGALLAVVLAGVPAFGRLPGWPVAAVGLALNYLTGELASDHGIGVVPRQPPTTGQVLTVLASALGAGLVLGGALLALSRSARSLRWPLAAGLATGLVLHSAIEDLLRLEAGAGYPDVGRAWPVQVGVTMLVVVVAAVLAHLDRPGPGAPAARPRIGPLVATAVAALVTLGGLVIRWWVVDVFRISQDGLVGPRRERFVEAFAYFSPVAVATVAALVLLGYAYRAGRAPAARWVVLGFAAGPLLLFGLRLSSVGDRAQAYLVVLVGLVAVAAGAALARFTPGLLPWDAAGLLLAALAMPLAAPVVRAELPAAAQVPSLLSALGLGLAVGFGLVLAATAPAGGVPSDVPAAGPAARGAAAGGSEAGGVEAGGVEAGGVEESGRVAGVLALGMAALVLSALALAPSLLRGLSTDRLGEPALTVPVLTGVAALVLVLLFGFGRAVDRIRRDLRAEAALVTAHAPLPPPAAPAPAGAQLSSGPDAAAPARPGADAAGLPTPGSDAARPPVPGADAGGQGAPGTDAVGPDAPGTDAVGPSAPSSGTAGPDAPGSGAVGPSAPSSGAARSAERKDPRTD
ncbi:hypothetical protein RMN56_16060 [Micromonospora halotolerans]|uniref:Uncharacterized protein n=1 Tax=Micromonospora halotolerans TaxID=709879 RepID=A0ABZ0A6C3_9ACTN|nr:hypothetical protein [Micromonospora halotolerans]WNM42760.1 hypothetical protein RMN56_16060 [Micromonospora halotolerans]